MAVLGGEIAIDKGASSEDQIVGSSNDASERFAK